MAPFRLFSLCALAGFAIACSSPQSATTPALAVSGAYDTADPGAFRQLVFSGASYTASRNAPCDGAGANACADRGTYVLDAAHRTLALTSTATGQTISLSLEIRQVQNVATQALHGLDGNALTGDGGGALTGSCDGGCTLTQSPVQLIKSFGACLTNTCQSFVSVIAPLAQMNDLSVLYPLPQTQDELDNALLKADGNCDPSSRTASLCTSGMTGTLLPEALYQTAATGLTSPHPIPLFASLRVVAFRLDPCVTEFTTMDDPNCHNQIRLILQPMTFVSGRSVASDGGFHAIYSLTRDQFTAALNAVIAARQASDSSGADLGPLNVHPLMVNQGLGGSMATALNRVVLTSASASNLVTVAAFATVIANHFTWNFQTINIANGSTQPLAIPALGGALRQTLSSQNEPGDGTLALQSQQSVQSPDNLMLLLNGPQAEQATADQRQAAYDSAIHIENPDLQTVLTIDCGSCHSAQLARRVVGEDFFHLSPDNGAQPFSVDPSVVPTSDMQQSTPATPPTGNLDLDNNLHAFSYNGTTPMIIQRTINETAAILAYVRSGGANTPTDGGLPQADAGP
jgi:hypothetical protein